MNGLHLLLELIINNCITYTVSDRLIQQLIFVLLTFISPMQQHTQYLATNGSFQAVLHFFQAFISQFIYFIFILATKQLLLRTGTDPKPTCGSWLAGSIKQQVHQVVRGLAARGDSSLEKKLHQISTHGAIKQIILRSFLGF